MSAHIPLHLLLAALAALAAFLWGARVGAFRSGAWLAAAALGQSASLQLVVAGPRVGYQHIRAPVEAWREAPAAVLFLVLLALMALLESLRNRRIVLHWFRTRGWPAGVPVALVISLCLSVFPSLPLSIYATELVVGGVVQLLAFGCLGLFAASIPADQARQLGARMAALLGPPHRGPGRVDRFTIVLAIGVTLTAALLSALSYQRHPHIPDEVAFLMQARYFARGLLSMPVPPVPQAFDLDLMEITTRGWISVLNPAWPAVLAVGVLAGVPWLVNPILGGVCVVLLKLLLEEITDRRTARVATLLLATSPWHLLLAMSFMNHTMVLALVLLSALAVARLHGGGRWELGLVAGLAFGVMAMARPLEGIAVGVCLAVPLFWLLRKGGLRPIAAFAFGAAASGALGLWYNDAITGNPFVFAAEPYFDRVYGPGRYGIGFGTSKGLGWEGLDPLPGHGAADVALNSVLNGAAVNVELSGWWTGSLFLVTLGALAFRNALSRAMVASALTIVGAHAFYWFTGGPDFGARYWFLVIVPCVVLAAIGLQRLESFGEPAEPSTAPPGPSPVAGRFHLAAVALSALALLTFLPWRAQDKYRGYRRMVPDVRQIARDPRLSDALVLVRGRRHPDWASAAVYNPLDLRTGRTIFAWDRDEATRAALVRAYPDRPVWILEGPTVTGRGYELGSAPVARPPVAADATPAGGAR